MKVCEAIKAHSGKHEYCVYHLINDGSVIYVGSSRQVSTRLYSHKIGDMAFDSVKVYVCDSIAEMYSLEARFIVKFNPKNNKSLPSSSVYKSTKDCIGDASATMSELVRDLPVAFSRTKSSYLDACVYSDFISSIEKFAEKKIAELVETAHKKECR